VTGEPSRVTAAVTGPQQAEAADAAQALVPAPLPKGAGRPVRRAGPPGIMRRRGPLPMTMLPRVGSIEGATRVSPQARAGGASDAGRRLRDVAVPGT
jgi:hypothetical protein